MSISTITNANPFGGIDNPLTNAVKLASMAFALNAIQAAGVSAASLSSENPEFDQSFFENLRNTSFWNSILGTPKFWDEKRCETVFGKVSQFIGFGYCSWLQSCEKIGPEECMKNKSSRNFALKVMEQKIEAILPKTVEGPLSSTIEDCFLSSGCPDLGEKKTSSSKKTEESIFTPINDCTNPSDCPEIDKTKIHPRAQKATEVITSAKRFNSTREEYASWIKGKFVPPEWIDVQEVLRFRSDDPREKFLFTYAEKDHNGALDPKWISGILSRLSQNFDLKVQVVKKHQDICKAIDSGKKTGNLAHILISGHGDPKSIVFDADSVYQDGKEYWDIKNSMIETTNFAGCFSGIRPNGKIILLSCSTGGMKNIGTYENPVKNGRPFDNLAQKMADAAKRVVVAPTDLAYPSEANFLSDDDVVLYHPESRLYSLLPFYNTNLFKSFRPVFKDCSPRISESKIHKRELDSLDIIKNEFLEKSLLHKEDKKFEKNQFLQICKDDPREKVLFFSAHYDKNGALEPELNKKIISVFADRFDLEYRVVESKDDVCKEIKRTSKLGKIVTVVIQGHGTSTEGMILSQDSSGNAKKIKASDEYSDCFSGVEKDGTIVLMGSSLGQNGDHKDNIAKKIANDSQRTVLATTCPIFPSHTTIQSINPLMLKHSGYSSAYNYLYMNCPENGENHFKTFSPVSLGKEKNHEEL